MEFICNFGMNLRNILLSSEAINTLIGAVVGGFLALQGSLVISNREWKRENKIKITESTYKPLYN